MRLTSTAFPEAGKIPTRFTCDGVNVSPPLSWADTPKGARSFALVCSDPDAPSGVWFHWAVFDIPPEATALAEHWGIGDSNAKEARNDFGKRGYGGPCPLADMAGTATTSSSTPSTCRAWASRRPRAAATWRRRADRM